MNMMISYQELVRTFLKSDMILTQKTFADILTADASEEEIKRVVVLNKLTDKEEIETKIVAFLKERHLKVADYE
ncbi:hypothetical protein [Klebsiella pneumoniae]|uniref:hypothetical protein n=1 Tax=Klebsiella pneumoniae TaxID=573 RepID=UPI002FE2A8E8